MFLGRDIDFMRRVSEQTGLQVVAVHRHLHLRPPAAVLRQPRRPTRSPTSSSPTSSEGIQGTEIKAAFIKCAADEPGVTENVEKVHRAAARASVRTGAPIMAHSRPASNTAPRQIEIFLEEGVDPAKVQIAHTGDTDDLDYIEGVLETGVWIGLDRYGLEMYLPYEQRQATTLALLERGYADRLFLSADSCGTIDWFAQEAIEQMLAAGMAKDWDIRIVHQRVIPDLEAGRGRRGPDRDDHGPQPGELAHRRLAVPTSTASPSATPARDSRSTRCDERSRPGSSRPPARPGPGSRTTLLRPRPGR